MKKGAATLRVTGRVRGEGEGGGVFMKWTSPCAPSSRPCRSARPRPCWRRHESQAQAQAQGLPPPAPAALCGLKHLRKGREMRRNVRLCRVLPTRAAPGADGRLPALLACWPAMAIHRHGHNNQSWRRNAHRGKLITWVCSTVSPRVFEPPPPAPTSAACRGQPV